MIPDSEIPACPEFEVKSKLGKLFMNEKTCKNILLKFMKLIPFFMSITKKKKVDKNGCKYILFRIDVYFAEYFLAGEIDEQNHEDRELLLQKKKQEILEKNLGCKFIIINTSDAEEVMIQIMKLVKYKYLLVTLKTDN